MDERRNDQRRRTIRAGKIVYGSYRYVLDCMVREISPTGARLRVEGAEEVPGEFMLYDMSDAVMQPVTVIWRKGKDVGVTFHGEAVSVHDSQDPRLARFRFM
ncbi:hypothetical protein A6302_00818 [Methylobrevis pamukkalensis]|uniref:PilZ domain-containing protein n=2 Tax=Methylobrevis pamukkalensis TaxID=1439726 RepID=A0A1E3H7Y1_9HYPH|nr:hypothetical protein A6302_00818 [Methylobrevis pamukkalensis]